jgi:hypothetical protein
VSFTPRALDMVPLPCLPRGIHCHPGVAADMQITIGSSCKHHPCSVVANCRRKAIRRCIEGRCDHLKGSYGNGRPVLSDGSVLLLSVAPHSVVTPLSSREIIFSGGIPPRRSTNSSRRRRFSSHSSSVAWSDFLSALAPSASARPGHLCAADLDRNPHPASVATDPG